MNRCAQTCFLAAAALVAGAALSGYSPSAAAQPATVQSGGEDELQAAYANAADVAEGKRVAQTSCASCHGMNGIGAAKGTPNLAGQRAPYLYIELRAYRAGARNNQTMTKVVKFLSDDALLKAAAYYASLDPAQPAPASAKASASRPDPVQAGKTASAGCAGCHGEDGVSKIPGTPSLAGLDPSYLVAAMTAYKSGQRKNDLMKSLVGALGEADMNNIALYFALQKPARSATPVHGDAAAGKAASAACAGCHGEQGVSGKPEFPSLAGQDPQYLALAMRSYAQGARSNDSMKGPAAALDERAAANLAAYFTSQQPQAPNVRKPMTPEQLAERCDRCHGINGNSIDPRTPALASQRADYLESALHAYRKGTRTSVAMAAMSDMLNDSDVEGIAAFYARQKARSVVYVMVPGK